MLRNLKNKVAIVTGASRGIGKIIAIRLAENGVNVVVNYNKSKNQAVDTLSEVREHSKKSIIFKADISKYDEVEKMVKKTIKEYKKIDILVNNAGLNITGDFINYKYKDYKKVIDVNLSGYWICCRLVSVEMVKNGSGRIINISSVHDKIPAKCKIPYSISKSGVKMLTKSLALELAKYNISVNAISPGGIYTDINKKVLSDEDYKKKILSKIPLGRIGEPEDVAGLVLFLCSEESNYITGTTTYVDGGFLLT